MICPPDSTSVLASYTNFQAFQDGSVYSDRSLNNDWREVISKIKSMFHYGPDWDDEGSLPPSAVTISRALEHALKIQNAGAAPQLVYASANREIVFEWHSHTHVRTIMFYELDEPKLSSRYKTLAR